MHDRNLLKEAKGESVERKTFHGGGDVKSAGHDKEMGYLYLP